jgi:hypothetical protein
MASVIMPSIVGRIMTADNINTKFCKQIHEGSILVSQMFIFLVKNVLVTYRFCVP